MAFSVYKMVNSLLSEKYFLFLLRLLPEYED